MSKEKEETYVFGELSDCYSAITGFSIYSSRINEKESILGSIDNPLLARKLTRVKKIIQPEIDGFIEAKQDILKKEGGVMIVCSVKGEKKTETREVTPEEFEKLEGEGKIVKKITEKPVDFQNKMGIIQPQLEELMTEEVDIFIPKISINDFNGQKVSGDLIARIDIALSD